MYLITGGSGFLGINLCRYLIERGRRVRIFDLEPFNYREPGAVEPIIGDVRDPGAVARAMDGVEIVIHAAMALPLRQRQDILSTGVEGTRVVLEAAFSRGVSRLIFISSTAVYGIPDHHPVLEGDALPGAGPYGVAKIAAERYCRDFRSAGHCVSVLRPKTFVGPERLGVFEILYDWAYQGRNFPLIGRGDNLYQLLDVEDLCEVIYRCATTDPVSVNDTFNIGAKQFGTMRQNVQAVLDRAGHRKRVISLPARPTIGALKLLEWLGISPFYEWIYETAAKESIVSPDHLVKVLGFVPRFSNCEALVRNYDWYVLHRHEYQGKTGMSHRVPWKRGAIQLLGYLF
jgi:nucleoside-diphosphate-sugar epimerase